MALLDPGGRGGVKLLAADIGSMQPGGKRSAVLKMWRSNRMINQINLDGICAGLVRRCSCAS
jgi:hypothetical protein